MALSVKLKKVFITTVYILILLPLIIFPFPLPILKKQPKKKNVEISEFKNK